MKFLRRTFTIIVIILLVAKVGWSQTDPTFSHYMVNNLYFNPAYAGVSGLTQMNLIHRTQWAGNQDDAGMSIAPNTQLVSVNTPLMNINSGVGVHVTNDYIGSYNTMNATFSFAYHIRIAEAKLSLGASAGFISRYINKDELDPIDVDDLTLQNMEPSDTRPDFGVGAYFRTEKLFVGVSAKHIIANQAFQFGYDPASDKIPETIYFTSGYQFEINYDFLIIPSVLISSDFATPPSVEVSGMAKYRDKIRGGLSFRYDEGLTALFGYSLLKDETLTLGYAFDYVFLNSASKKATSHELLLSYILPVLTGSAKKVVRTPRFRH